MSNVHLYLYQDDAPGWPTNGCPRKAVSGRHFEAEVVVLPQGHGVRLTADNRTLSEYVAPTAPAPGPAADVDLGEVPSGGYFANDRLLYRGEHVRESFADDAAYEAGRDAAEQALDADGAESVPGDTPAGGPRVRVVPREHEIEVRALYCDPAARTLLRWTSVVGLKLKMRR